MTTTPGFLGQKSRMPIVLGQVRHRIYRLQDYKTNSLKELPIRMNKILLGLQTRTQLNSLLNFLEAHPEGRLSFHTKFLGRLDKF